MEQDDTDHVRALLPERAQEHDTDADEEQWHVAVKRKSDRRARRQRKNDMKAAAKAAPPAPRAR